MQVYKDLSQIPAFRNAVLTIGTFDGVHIGHQQIITQLKAEAALVNGETVIVSFHPHPRKIVSSVPGDVKLLTTLEERIKLLTEAGIDHFVVIPFNHQFANQTATQYLEDFLYNTFKPHTVIIGYDHRFGKGRTGDYHLLEKFAAEKGFKVKEIEQYSSNDIIVSSTIIRQHILVHNIALANTYLGRTYSFEGIVVEGNKRGRTIGFPTANIHVGSEEKLIPGDGVYAVKAKLPGIDETIYNGMMNIGLRPTVDGKQRVIEVNIFDFDADIYGQHLQVFLHHYLRGEQKFNGLEELKMQLAADKLNAKFWL